jgi:hypothetical protein
MNQPQKHLLMLRHALICDHNTDCPTFPKACRVFKQLHIHLKKCVNENCTETYCASAKVLLAHYHSCQNKDCFTCTPIREEIALSLVNDTV